MKAFDPKPFIEKKYCSKANESLVDIQNVLEKSVNKKP